MTSSVPKYNTIGIPYTQHKVSSNKPAFSTINSSSCGNINYILLQNNFLAIAKQLYVGGSGIDIDRTGTNPIINWDPSEIDHVGSCSTPLSLKGSTITYGAGAHIFDVCSGVREPTPFSSNANLNALKTKTYLSIGPNVAYPVVDSSNPNQLGVPLIFGDGSTVEGSTTPNSMTFVMAPYRPTGGGTKGMIISKVDSGGELTALMILT